MKPLMVQRKEYTTSILSDCSTEILMMHDEYEVCKNRLLKSKQGNTLEDAQRAGPKMEPARLGPSPAWEHAELQFKTSCLHDRCCSDSSRPYVENLSRQYQACDMQAMIWKRGMRQVIVQYLKQYSWNYGFIMAEMMLQKSMLNLASCGKIIHSNVCDGRGILSDEKIRICDR